VHRPFLWVWSSALAAFAAATEQSMPAHERMRSRGSWFGGVVAELQGELVDRRASQIQLNSASCHRHVGVEHADVEHMGVEHMNVLHTPE